MKFKSESMKLSDSSSNIAEETPIPGAQPPTEIAGTQIGHPHRVAAGLPALYQSGRFTLQKMGIRRGLSTWIKVNQKDSIVKAAPGPIHTTTGTCSTSARTGS